MFGKSMEVVLTLLIMIYKIAMEFVGLEVVIIKN